MKNRPLEEVFEILRNKICDECDQFSEIVCIVDDPLKNEFEFNDIKSRLCDDCFQSHVHRAENQQREAQ